MPRPWVMTVMRGVLAVVLGVVCLGVAGCAPPGAGAADTSDIALAAAEVEREPGEPAGVAAVAASLQGLSADLYTELTAEEDANVAFSPYSIAVALAMTVNGATGETAAEMLEVLGVEDLAAYNAGLNALTQHVEGLAGEQEREEGEPVELILDTANTLFGEQSETWGEDFLVTLGRHYGAGMRGVDFIGAPEPARALINAWTSEQTREKIPEILPAGSIHPMVRLVLVNALYLKAPWEETFEESDTSSRPFTRGDGSEVEVDMMTAQLDRTAYGTGSGWQAVRLPYAGGGLAMTVVLPDVGRLSEVEALVADGGLDGVLAGLEPAPVSLSLPRWEFRSQASLAEALARLGMPQAFADDAEFGPMTGEPDNDLFIGEVFHEAYVAVDEEGAEAAAASAVVMEALSAGPQRVSLVVDRPFLFVIHDVEHRTPLFVGRVADPTA